MSEPVPQPAEAVRAAVRRVRLATAQLSSPLGAVGIALAAAEALPGVLQPALASLAPSPFGMLGDVLGMTPVAPGATGATGAKPRGAARPPAAQAAPAPQGGSAPTGPTAAMAALGRFVTDELTALGVTAPVSTPARTQRTASPFGEAVASMAGSIVGDAGHGSFFTPDATDALTALGVAGTETLPQRVGAGVAIAARAGGAPPVVAEAARTATTGVAAGLSLLETLVQQGEAAFGLAPPAQHPTPKRGAAPAGSLIGELLRGLPALPAAAPAPAAGTGTATAPVTNGVAALDDLRRRLLDPAAPAAAPATPGGTVPASPGAQADPGLRGSDDRAPLEPDDVAWLVNEALIEQARRHGVDLS